MGLGFSISFAVLFPLIFKLFIYGEMISIVAFFCCYCCPFPMLNEMLFLYKNANLINKCALSVLAV